MLPPVTLAACDDDLAEPPKRDGRRTHIVDRALDYVALADEGLSAARIARKRRKSQGYVSIALRLGRAIAGMEPSEIAALRSPRITWKLAQRIVREDADVVGIRHQLRTALGGFSSHNLDGRKNRKGRRDGTGRVAHATGAGRAIGVAWGWDAAWFARDPIGFAEAHLRYLAGVQRSVQQRAARSAAARDAERVPVGQGIRSLQRSLAASQLKPTVSVTGPSEQHALAVLAILERKLAEASREAATLLAARQESASPAVGSVAVAGASSRVGRLTVSRPRLTVSASASAPVAASFASLASLADDSVADALEADLRD
ncbi:hypothetical protein J421_5513 (plasmid) [Gemmatirosa kalamazoonensis]|uniref:Uncharacterized protein n=1 Tax=Gemmatirosa kalamazoonensis TaxID=861299 RepID=W0RTX9_9BACT|nr:hypothetical protein J421_5513 [Gemmatirosa kalamazoonensis]